MMLSHYLRSALARFRKTPFTTGANILTLALGLACFIAAYATSAYWKSGDFYHPGAERTVYVSQMARSAVSLYVAAGGPRPLMSAPALSPALREEMPELEAVAQFGANGPYASSVAVSTGERKAFLDVVVGESQIFDLFAFEFVEGGPETALQAPDDVVLVESAAQRLFGRAPALGETLRVENQRDVRVSAVIAPVRQPSFMGHTDAAPVRFEMIGNKFEVPPGVSAWAGGSAATFVRLPPSMSIETFQARLDELVARHAAGLDERLRPIQQVVPLSEAVEGIVDARFSAHNYGISASIVLLGLGGLILLVACVNYANLTAAHAETQLKQTGMRRVLGAGRRDLLAQQFVEAGLLALPALGLAVLVVALAAPVFQTIFGVDVTYILTARPDAVLVLAGVAFASVAAAAIYPALRLTRVRAADALGQSRARTGSGPVARVLVGVQFLSASFLLIVVTVAQLQHTHLRAPAFDAADDPVIVLHHIGRYGVDFDTLTTELLAQPQIRSATMMVRPPWSSGIVLGRQIGRTPGAFNEGVTLSAELELVGANFFETMGIGLLAGRVFDPERDPPQPAVVFGQAPPPNTEPTRLVIDRRLAEALGFSEPEAAVGQTVYLPPPTFDDAAAPTPTGVILGVVEPARTRVARLDVVGEVRGAAFEFIDRPPGIGDLHAAVRVDPRDTAGALAAIERVWDALAPDVPLNARFTDDLFEEAYAPFAQIAGVFVVLSACALAISTVGILAIAVHVAARRRHEIGVRKVLGASTGRVLRMLIADFSKPVIVGNVIAWPFAWMAAQTYLQSFADRTPLTPLPFLISLAITLLIAWLAVGGQAYRAARVKPALVLRAE